MVTNSPVQLSTEEWQHIVQLGAERHIQELEGKLENAQQQIATFESKYGMSFAQLQETGLPEDGGIEAHEDYVEWSSWEGHRADLEEVLAIIRSRLDQNV